MNLLDELVARMNQPVNPGTLTLPDPKPKLSLLDRLRMAGDNPFADGGTPDEGSGPAWPTPQAAPIPPAMAAQAGILAPGIGGLGPQPTAAAAPVAPAEAPPVDPTPAPSPIPVPIPRPSPSREADGTPSPVAPASDLSSRNRGPAAEEEAVKAPTGAPAVAGPQMAQPSLWDDVGAFGGKIMKGLSDHSNTLLALGAGFAGAPNIGQGISRASQYAIPATQQDLKNRITTGSQSATYQALREAGVPQQQAIAAIGNPELQKRLLDSYIGDRKSEIKTIKSKDAFGNETERLVAVNPYDNTVKEVSGGAAGAGAPAAGGTNTNSFAPGVTAETVDHTKVGDDYLKQFSPEVQDSVKNYLAGRSSPTGRQQSAQMIKMVAQKYGMDTGMPADDTAISQRKQWANSLGDVKNGVGLQGKGFQQGLEHAKSLSDSLVKLGNTNGFGFEPAANWLNSAKNLTTGQTNIKNEIQAKSQALAGEVGKLYSGQTGGGVHERAATQQNLGKTDQSPVAAAGGLEATIELMEGGLRSLEQRRDSLFPNGDAPRGSNFRGPEQEKAIEYIKHNLAILKGEVPADRAPTSPTAATASTGVKWRIVQP